MSPSEAESEMTLKSIDAITLKRRLDAGDAILIDIREHDEHAREHIIGARLAPLSAIDAHDFDRDRAKAAVFHCKSGMRTQANTARLLARGFKEAYFLEGGIEGWKAAGFPVHANRKAPLELMRQVQITGPADPDRRGAGGKPRLLCAFGVCRRGADLRGCNRLVRHGASAQGNALESA